MYYSIYKYVTFLFIKFYTRFFDEIGHDALLKKNIKVRLNKIKKLLFS